MLCGGQLLRFTRWTPFENSDKKFSFILWTNFWRNETILFWVYVYIRSFLHQIIMNIWFFKRRGKAGSQSYPEFTEWTNNVSPLSKKSYACCHLNWQRAYFLQQNVPWQPLNQWRQLTGSLLTKENFIQIQIPVFFAHFLERHICPVEKYPHGSREEIPLSSTPSVASFCCTVNH